MEQTVLEQTVSNPLMLLESVIFQAVPVSGVFGIDAGEYLGGGKGRHGPIMDRTEPPMAASEAVSRFWRSTRQPESAAPVRKRDPAELPGTPAGVPPYLELHIATHLGDSIAQSVPLQGMPSWSHEIA